MITITSFGTVLIFCFASVLLVWLLLSFREQEAENDLNEIPDPDSFVSGTIHQNLN